MWECPVCGTQVSDFEEMCPVCWYVRGVNNFIDWNSEGQSIFLMNMKRIFLMLIFFLLISPLSAVEIRGVDFEIPDKYSGGELKSYGYIFNNEDTFSILCIDFLMPTKFDEWNIESLSSENITVGSHEAVHYVNKKNISHLIFSVGDSIFCISWNSSKITPEIEKLVNDSPNSNLTSQQFHSKLENELAEYAADKELEKEVIFPWDFGWDDYDRDYDWD